MHKFVRSMWLSLALLAGAASVADATVFRQGMRQPAVPTSGPADTRRPLVAALKANDAAALILAVHGETELADFLSTGASETKASIADRIARESGNDEQQRLARLWSTLAQADGVALVSAELYPLWQSQVPKMLANAQLGLTAMGAAIADDQSMTALERTQLIELQWALIGWLSRTDFADPRLFERVLGIARDWILSSGATDPRELLLTRPDRRLKLADDGIRSLKRALGLYGIDADALLGSIRIEEIRHEARRATLRTSFAVLGVPLMFEEDLLWYDGDWVDAKPFERAAPADSESAAAFSDVEEASAAD